MNAMCDKASLGNLQGPAKGGCSVNVIACFPIICLILQTVKWRWRGGSVMDCHVMARCDSRWRRCKNRASCPSQGTVDEGAVSK